MTITPFLEMRPSGATGDCSSFTLDIRNAYPRQPGYPLTPPDDVAMQFRQLATFGLNAIFGSTPNEISRLFHSGVSVGVRVIDATRVLPDVFTQSREIHPKELDEFAQWLLGVLQLGRNDYEVVMKALNAYERALHVLPDEPSLSYALLVFCMETLAVNSEEFQPEWDDVASKDRLNFDNLLSDPRIEVADTSWQRGIQGFTRREASSQSNSPFRWFRIGAC